MQMGSGRHSRPEVCWRPRSSWLRSSGSSAPGCRSQPAGGHSRRHGRGTRRSWESRCARAGRPAANCAPSARVIWPPEVKRQGVNGRRWAGLRLLIVRDDVQKGFEAGLDSGVGGVGVNLEDEVGLGAQFGSEHGVSEGVDGATEVAHAEQEEVRVLPGQGDGIEDLVGRVPHRGPVPDRREAVGRDDGHAHAGKLLAHRLRALGGEGVVAAAGQENRRLSRSSPPASKAVLSQLRPRCCSTSVWARTAASPGRFGQVSRISPTPGRPAPPAAELAP